MFKKLMLISMMFLLLISTNSCEVLFPQYPEVIAGTFTEYGEPRISAYKDNQFYMYPLDKPNIREDIETVLSKLKFKLKVIVTEISEDEHNKANRLNVFKDFATDKFYHLEVYLGTNDIPLTQIDYKYVHESRDNIGYSYIFDRGSIQFFSTSSHSSTSEDKKIKANFQLSIIYYEDYTFNNHCFLDDT